MESCSKIKDGIGKLALEEVEMQRIWKEYFEHLFNTDSHEQVAIHMCDFDGVRRCNYFGGEPTRRTEVEVRVGKLKNGKAAAKDDKRWR